MTGFFLKLWYRYFYSIVNIFWEIVFQSKTPENGRNMKGFRGIASSHAPVQKHNIYLCMANDSRKLVTSLFLLSWVCFLSNNVPNFYYATHRKMAAVTPIRRIFVELLHCTRPYNNTTYTCAWPMLGENLWHLYFYSVVSAFRVITQQTFVM